MVGLLLVMVSRHLHSVCDSFLGKSIEILTSLMRPNRDEYYSSGQYYSLEEFLSSEEFFIRKQKYVNILTRSLKKLKYVNEELLNSLSREVSRDNVNHVQKMLGEGANPNAVDSSGNRPIHLVIKNSPRNFELIQDIIRFGADINVVNKHGSTPVVFSLGKCQKTLEIVIKAGSDLNFQCLNGWTALMIASMIEDFQNVRTLLEHGAKVNIYDASKKTALWFAVYGRFHRIIKELLEYGANPAIRDADDDTVLCKHLREENPKLHVINELLLYCASFKDLENNAQASFLKIMKICEDRKNNPIYRICVKRIIKIHMLLTNNYCSVSKFENWYDFALLCCVEIRYMETFNVCCCRTVPMLLARCLEGDMPLESELEALLPLVANNYFSNYADILKAQLRKPFMRKMFKNLIISAKKKGRKGKDVILNFDVTSKIQSYLSDDDVKNLVLAAYVKEKPYMKSSYTSLYPKGKSYKWNDVMKDVTKEMKKVSHT